MDRGDAVAQRRLGRFRQGQRPAGTWPGCPSATSAKRWTLPAPTSRRTSWRCTVGLGYSAVSPVRCRAELPATCGWNRKSDGPWFGRWGVNFVYGTGAAVLPAMEAIGEDMRQPHVYPPGRGLAAGGTRTRMAAGASAAAPTWTILATGRRPLHGLAVGLGPAGADRGGRSQIRKPASEGSPISAWTYHQSRRQLGRALFHRHRISRVSASGNRQDWDTEARGGRPPGSGYAGRIHDQLPPIPELLAPAGAGTLRPGHSQIRIRRNNAAFTGKRRPPRSPQSRVGLFTAGAVKGSEA